MNLVTFSSNVVLEELVRKNESFFDTWWVARGKMSILKGFSWLEVCFYIQGGLISESFSFVHNCIQKCSFSVRNFSCKFYSRVMPGG